MHPVSTPDASPQPRPGPRPISEDSRRTIARLAGTSVLIATGLVSLITGILIGYATKRRLDRWGHGHQ